MFRVLICINNVPLHTKTNPSSLPRAYINKLCLAEEDEKELCAVLPKPSITKNNQKQADEY